MGRDFSFYIGIVNEDSDEFSGESIVCNRSNNILGLIECKYFSYDDLVWEINRLSL